MSRRLIIRNDLNCYIKRTKRSERNINKSWIKWNLIIGWWIIIIKWIRRIKWWIKNWNIKKKNWKK